jgi:hypothetical protein
MKYYRIEPTHKKSVIENTIFRRKDENGNYIFLKRELGWRWGSFLFSVPETEDEINNYINDQGYETFLEWASDNGFEDLIESETYAGIIVKKLLPSESDEFVDVTEDYPNATMMDAWDGIWEDWIAYSFKTELSYDEKESMTEEASEAFYENNEEGVEELGWEYIDSTFEIQCPVSIQPCDEDDSVLENA